jgi:hypothetical protein
MWNSLPEKFRVDEMQLFDFMLKLYPPACDDQKKALEMHVRTTVAMGGSMPPYEAITETIMTAVLKRRLEQPATTLYTGGDNCNDGGGRGGSDPPPRGVNFLLGGSDPPPLEG